MPLHNENRNKGNHRDIKATFTQYQELLKTDHMKKFRTITSNKHDKSSAWAGDSKLNVEGEEKNQKIEHKEEKKKIQS